MAGVMMVLAIPVENSEDLGEFRGRESEGSVTGISSGLGMSRHSLPCLAEIYFELFRSVL